MTDTSKLARVLTEAMTLGVDSIDDIVDAITKLLVLLGQVAEGIIQGRDAGAR